MDLRLSTRWVLYTLGTAFVFTFLLCRFDIPSSLPAFENQRWASASGPMGDDHSTLGDIHNSTLGFEKIFVINLPSRTDRRDRMVLQAALSDMQVEFIDGVLGKDVVDKAVPTSPDHERLPDASIGSWRGHLNAAREIVHRNLTSALILEDDIDWDVRLRDQLHGFALSAQALTQPLRGRAGAYADPTYPKPLKDSPESVLEMNFHDLPATVPPTTSPYGDNWDLLWLGHCGMHIPFGHSKTIPKGVVLYVNDKTVAPKRNLWTVNNPFTLTEKYPEHTRAYHHVQEGLCSLGYALSQRGARKLLHEVALKDVSAGFDMLLRWYCEGDKGRAPGRQCLTTQPGLFHHHMPVGPVSALSDVKDHGDGFRDRAKTDMVRWSVRLNADALLEGSTDFVDQYPDD